MRGIVAVGLAMVLAACASETPTATKQGTAGSAVRDIVLVNVWQRARDGSGLNDQRRLIVEQFPDRVSVAPDGDLAASATRPSTLRRARAVGRPDIAALRERSGLPPVSARAMPSRASGRTWKGPRRYITRLVTADRSQRQLQDLRAHADAEERVGPTQLRFQRTEGDVAQAWVFDEAIGAVVEMTVDRGGRRHLSIRHDYERGPDGYVLAGSESQWFGADGQVTRRATTRFLTR